MRYSNDIKETVRQLRQKGLSLNQIREKTGIPITTIRLWIVNIVLTDRQKSLLFGKTQLALQRGRIKAQALRKLQRKEITFDMLQKGAKEVGKLSLRDSFIAGIALYWAEGFKNVHERRLGFCNSDPDMILFYIRWLKSSLQVETEDLIARLTLNISYKDKTKEIEEYWSWLTGIPLNQFTKTFYQNTQWRKQYSTDTYRGVLRLHVKGSLEYLLKMKGWIAGLKSGKISQA